MSRSTATLPHTSVIGLVAVLLIGANLRPAITAVGPLVDRIGADLDLRPSALGLLGSIPLFAFALVSPLVHQLSRRFGSDRLLVASTLLLAAATVLRSLPGGATSLWVGTILIGAFVAVGNVIVPAVIKRDFSSEVPRVTGLYSAMLGGTSAFASGLALPVADAAGWRVALGFWAVLSVIAALVWLPRMRGGVRGADPAPAVAGPTSRMWTSPTAWQVTGVMATQATTYFMLVTWLPSIEIARGVDPVAAGWETFVYQIVGLVAGVVVTFFMRGRTDHRAVGVVISVFLIVGVAGMLVAPALSVLWIVLAGLSGGSSLVIALALVGERTRSTADAGRLSGMAQSIGYLLAVIGPAGAGLLFDATGSWTAPLLGVIAVTVVQIVVCLLAGRDRSI